MYETNGNNEIIHSYVYSESGQLLAMRKGNDTFFYHYNAHGDVIALTNQQGEVVARYEYDAWGNPIKVEEDSVVADNPFRYAGYQYDKETGMYYLIARYYHPEHGVFLSLDPDPGDDDDILTQNGYTYANNNPVMLVDPDGHWVWLAINAGFAIYDGYKAYKSGADWKGITWAVGSNFIKIGYLKKASKLVKLTTKSSSKTKNVVYISKNNKGVVQYVGITNNYARRAAEHLRSKGIRIEVLMKNLTRSDARAVEQALIEIHGLQKNGGTLMNKINSISKKNPSYAKQLKRGYQLLKSIGYK